MALTNDQITAQNFKDFYNQIRPYLNGQVPVFANRFNKSDLYSTDEQFIGRWTDGKPIYQKTATFTCTATYQNQQIVDIGISNVDTAVSINGMVVLDNNVKIPVNTYANGTAYCATWLMDTDKIAFFNFYNNRIVNQPVTVTVQYTKSTDSAVTISDGTEYSTTEQIVGKWIDGRPIYQKTVQGTTPASSGTRVDVGLPTLVQIIDVEGYVVDKDDWTIFVGTQKQEGVINQDFFVCHNVSGDSKIWFGCGSSTVNRPYTLTFRYIKSS